MRTFSQIETAAQAGGREVRSVAIKAAVVRSVLKIPKDVPLDIVALPGCGTQTGAGGCDQRAVAVVIARANGTDYGLRSCRRTSGRGIEDALDGLAEYTNAQTIITNRAAMADA